MNIITLTEPPEGDIFDASQYYTKLEVTSLMEHVTWKSPAHLASTGPITLGSPPGTIDSVALVNGYRILLKDQANPIENGLYTYNTGVLARAADFDEDLEVSAGLSVIIKLGTLHAKSAFQLVTGPLVIGVDALNFTLLADPDHKHHVADLSDATTASKSFLTANHNLNATINPGTGNDSSFGYAVGSIWINRTLGTLWECSDASLSTAVWNQIGAALSHTHLVANLSNATATSKAFLIIAHNFDATTTPGVSNDSTQGYGVGSLWINKSTGTFWQCSNASVGAAVWNAINTPGSHTHPVSQISDATTASKSFLTANHNLNAIIPPTGSDNSTLGYGVGSIWIDTVLKLLWQCSNATGVAVWNQIGVASTTQIAQDLSLQTQISQVNTRNTALTTVPIAASGVSVISTLNTTVGTSAEWFIELTGTTPSASKRVGKIFATSDGTNVQHTPETSTANVGATGAGTVDSVVLSVTMSGTIMQLIATNSSANTFTAKYNRIILT